MNYISMKEFREQGYLQELNRQFLHPLGLALEVRVDEDGHQTLGGIQDYREDPEGMIYAPGVLDSNKTINIVKLQAERYNQRMETLGYYIQPLENE